MGLYVGDKSVGKIFEGQDDEVTELSSKTEGIFPEGEWGGADVITFGYTGADQHWTAPSKGELTIECWGAGAIGSKGGYAKGTINVNKGDKFSIVCGSHGNNGGTYGFNGTSNYASNYNGGGLAGVFTGDAAVGVNDAARALVIGGGAGGDGASSRRGGAGGGETGGNGAGGGCGGIGGGGGQTGKSGTGAQGSGQFKGGGPSGTYGSGGGAGWYGGNGNFGDSSGWDDCGAGGGSGYVIASATNRVLTQGGGSNTSTAGKVVLTFKGKEIPRPTYVTSAGAYHNADLGLISISTDGQNWITISDKNVGATVADPEDTDSYGDIFQYGNIYHFDGEGSGGTVTTEAQIPDLTGYEGGNLYSNDKYRTNIDWNAANKKLWKPVAFANLLSLQKGPCDRGFHIPSAEEWTAVLNAILELEGEEAEFSYDLIARYLLMAHPNARKGDGDFYSSNTSIYFTNSYIENQNKINAFVMIGDEGDESGGLSATDMNCGGYIRGFRDVAMVPTTEWTKIGGGSTVRLPLEYQEVEYIESTGTQWINGLRLPVDFKFTITAQFESTTQYYNVYDTTEQRPMLWVYTNGRFELNIDNMTAAGTIDNSKFITVVSDALGSTNKLLVDGTQVVEGTKISSISKDTTLFHRGASDGFKGKIKYVLIEGTGGKIRELVPCYRRIDGVIGMYDLVNDQFYANAGSGTFGKGGEINTPALPSDYMEVEYLQSICSGAGATSSGQIIDTLFIPTNKTRVGFKMSGWTQSGTSNQIFGEDINWTQGDGGFSIVTDNYSYNGPASNRPTGFNNGAVHHGTMGFNGVYRDGILVDNSRAGQALNATQTISLFGLHRNGTYVEHSSCKIHYYIIEEDGVWVRFFMPCYRKSDNKPGMYDLINKEFYTNSGTGDFVAGPIVMRDGRIPGENTIAYYEFNGNLNDSSGNGRNFSMKSGSFTYGTVGGIKYVDFSQNAWTNGISSFPHSISAYTRSFWMKFPNYSKTASGYFGIVLDFWKGGSGGTSRVENKNGVLTVDGINFTPPDYSKWYHYCIINDGGTVKLYVNATLVGTGAPGVTDGAVTLAFNNAPDTNGSQYAGQGQMAQLICENGKWTEEYLTEYYNSMKNIFE